jgi:hypothetical protein
MVAHPPDFMANKPSVNGAAHHDVPSFDDRDVSTAEIRELLDYVPSNCGRERWRNVLMAIHHMTGDSSEGLIIANNWSAKGGNKYKGFADVQRQWKSFKVGGGITGATLAEYAKEGGADLSAIWWKHNGTNGNGAAHDALGAKAAEEILKVIGRRRSKGKRASNNKSSRRLRPKPNRSRP